MKVTGGCHCGHIT